MDILQNILGGGQHRQQIQDFTQRYNQGSPYDGISDDEVHNHYQQIAPHLPPEMYEQAAQESYGRMLPKNVSSSVVNCSNTHSSKALISRI